MKLMYGLLLFSFLVLFQLSLAMSEEPKVGSITYQKPNPCYVVDRYLIDGDTLKLFLKVENKDRLCAQVIVEDRLDLPPEEAKDIKRVKVFIGNRLWQEFKVHSE